MLQHSGMVKPKREVEGSGGSKMGKPRGVAASSSRNGTGGGRCSGGSELATPTPIRAHNAAAASSAGSEWAAGAGWRCGVLAAWAMASSGPADSEDSSLMEYTPTPHSQILVVLGNPISTWIGAFISNGVTDADSTSCTHGSKGEH